MATLFWVGGSTAYDGTTNRLATTSGGSATVALITSSDTVTFDANSPAAAAVTTSAAISASTLTLAAGFTGSLTMSNTLTCAGAITHNQGTLNTNGQTVTATSYVGSAATARTLTLGASAVNLSLTTNAWNTGTTTNLTVTANTAVVTLSGNNAIFNSGTFNFNGMSVVFTGAAAPTFGGATAGNITVANLTRTGTSAKTDSILFAGNPTITTRLTLTSNSAEVNRLLVASATRGTSVTITAAAVTITNTADFMDITGAGAATWTVAGTSATYIGDAGGNSGITATTPATQTFSSGTKNWSDVTVWTSRVPLPQDDVVINTTTATTLTNDMPRMGKSINLTSFNKTINMASVVTEFYGSLTMSGSATYTNPAGNLTAAGRSSYNITWNGASITFSSAASLVLNCPGGTYTMQDNVTVGQANAAVGSTITNGTLASANGLTHSFGAITTAAGGNVTLGNSTWNLTATGVITIWNLNSSSTITSSSGSAIVIANASANARTFTAGAGKVYNTTLRYTVAGSTGSLISASNSTLYDVEFSDATNSRIFSLANTLTLTSPTPLTNFRGTSGKLMTLNSNTGGTRRDLSLQGGWSNTDYVTVTDIRCLEPYKLFVGANGTNGGNNINANITVPISGPLVKQAAPLVSVSSNTTGTITYSAATTAGNLLVCWIGSISSLGSPTLSGWAQADAKLSTSNIVMFYKVADGTETTVSPTWSNSLSPQIYGYEIANWSGQIPTLDTVNESTSASDSKLLTGSATNSAAPAISIVAFAANGSFGASSVTTLPTNSFQEDYNSQQTTGGLLKWGVLPLTSTGAQSTTFTWTTSRVPVSVIVNFTGHTAAASSGAWFAFAS